MTVVLALIAIFLGVVSVTCSLKAQYHLRRRNEYCKILADIDAHHQRMAHYR